MSHIDISVIKNFVGDNPEMIRGILKKFVMTAPAQIDEIRRSCVAGDNESIKSAAHKLKSSAKAVGAIRIAELCVKAENMAARNESVQAFTGVVDEIAQIFVLSKHELEKNKYI